MEEFGKATEKEQILAPDQPEQKLRRAEASYEKAYNGFTFTTVASSGRPGTPHSFFKESFSVEFSAPIESFGNDPAQEKDEKSSRCKRMRVHRHANGLCVVCVEPDAKRDIRDDKTPLSFSVKEIPVMSLAQKRKRGAKQLQGKNMNAEQGAVRPSDTLLSIGDHQTFPCAVFGSVQELNHSVTMNLLKTDPLLKGYLGIILPSGAFPPPATCVETTSTLEERK